MMEVRSLRSVVHDACSFRQVMQVCCMLCCLKDLFTCV